MTNLGKFLTFCANFLNKFFKIFQKSLLNTFFSECHPNRYIGDAIAV